MLLNVLTSLHQSTPADFVRLFHQSQMDWFGHLGDETELDFGRWIENAGWLLDAYLPPDISMLQLMEEMKAKHPRWRGCSLNPSMPTATIGEGLIEAGWLPAPLNIFYRSQKVGQISAGRSDLTIIPARASYRHYEELLGDCADDAILHLDDSHVDALLALRGGKPVGCISVLTSGQMGTVREWYVSPEHRGQGIGRVLLHRAMEICTRSVLRHVMVGLKPDANTASRLCQAFGFEKVGHWIAFTAAEDPR